MSRRRRIERASLALVAAALTSLLLAHGHRSVGFVRDEGIYFEASRSYARWVVDVARQPSRLGDARARDRRFRINHEHPALMKILAGVSARAAPPERESAAMRWPAQLLAGAGVALLMVAGWRRYGLGAGVLAALGFISLPRVWFHAGLHAFDVPVAVATLAVALVYLRSLREPWFALALGPTLGVAISIKHNALFLGPLLAGHLWWTLGRRRWRRTQVRDSPGAWVGLPLWSMVVLAPATALALWPWMWRHTDARLLEYVRFHAEHSWYNMEFLGVNYNQPPMPFAYPWVMTLATVPIWWLVLGACGMVLRSRGPSARGVGTVWRPVPDAGDAEDLLLWAVLAIWPLALIAYPWTPIFGGTKHWIVAYPFVALAAARAWSRLWGAVAPWRRWAEPLGLVLVLAPACRATWHGHPFGLSQYLPAGGGARGAAERGLNRGFWGHAVRPLLPLLESGGVELGDVHPLAREQYVREGAWPQRARATTLTESSEALHFYELHLRSHEAHIWEVYGTQAPAELVELDDVPLTALYRRPDSRRPSPR